MQFEFVDEINPQIGKVLDEGFEKYAEQNNVVCNYRDLYLIAKEGDEIAGAITARAYYSEVHVCDLIVVEKYRRQQIGKKLLLKIEEYAKEKGLTNINLSTYAFQAPEFYKKLGYQVEFVRENKKDPKITKYYLSKDI